MITSLLLVVLQVDASPPPMVTLAMAVPPPPPTPQARSLAELPDASRAAYRDAAKQLSVGDFHSATVALNALSQAHPQVGELYAARCSALLSLRRPAEAMTDCGYALKLNPSLWDARYGLAAAEDALGRGDAALFHYREYASANAPGVRTELLQQSQARIRALTPFPVPVVASARPVGSVVGYEREREPVQLRVQVGNASPAASFAHSSGQAPCRSSLDCGRGGWCKDRGDGLTVCMNHGRAGDFCSSSLDCGSGFWCREWGNGLNVCVGH